MEPLFAFNAWHYLYSIPLLVLSVFLMLVVLVQRGRGGGLTGALGGMGGQSAFGTKAGDLFTRITIVVAAIWILLAMVTIQRLSRPNVAARRGAAAAGATEGGTTKEKAGKEKPSGAAKTGETKPAGKAAKSESTEKPGSANEKTSKDGK